MGIISRVLLPEPLPLASVVLRGGDAPPWPATPSCVTACLPADRLAEGLGLEPRELRLFDRQGLLLLQALRRTEGSPAAFSRDERAAMPVHLAVGPARTELEVMRRWARRLSPGEPLPTVQPAAAVGLLPNTPLSLLSIHGDLTGEGAVWAGFSEAGFHALAGVTQALVDAAEIRGRRADARQTDGTRSGGTQTEGGHPADQMPDEIAEETAHSSEEAFSTVGLVAAVDSIGNHFVQDLWKHHWTKDPGDIPETCVLLRVGGPPRRGAMGLRGLLVCHRDDGLSCLLEAAEALGNAVSPASSVSCVSPVSTVSSAGGPAPDLPALRLLAEGFDGLHDLTARCGPALTTLLPLAIAAVLDDPQERYLLTLQGSDHRLYAVFLERLP